MLRVMERHQIEGLDERRRVFNRMADVARTEKGYAASFHYEGLTFESSTFRTIEETMQNLVERLQAAGFRNLRRRLNFRGQRYLAEREPWVDYPDPATPSPAGAKR